MSEEEEETPKKSGLGKILIFVGAGVIILGAGIGAGYVLFGNQQNTPEQIAAQIIDKNRSQQAEVTEQETDGEEALAPEKQSKESPKEEVFQTLYYEIPGNLTTNLKNSRRFLQIGVGISTRYDETILQNVEANLPAIRAAILATLSDYGEEDVVGREARQILSDDLKDTINTELEMLEGFGGVEGVLLTSFVMQ
jgi:flagellar FliL protein|tara:strand:- start:130 stop:714 length:585 start_codon:yes stop_codon:yes gene_type:complete